MKIDRFIVALTSSDRFIELQLDPEGSLCFASEVVKLEAINAELLEALERCFDIMNNGGTWSLEDQAAARAAIAKAKGETP